MATKTAKAKKQTPLANLTNRANALRFKFVFLFKRKPDGTDTGILRIFRTGMKWPLFCKRWEVSGYYSWTVVEDLELRTTLWGLPVSDQRGHLSWIVQQPDLHAKVLDVIEAHKAFKQDLKLRRVIPLPLQVRPQGQNTGIVGARAL